MIKRKRYNTPNTTSKCLFILVPVHVPSKCGTVSRDCVSQHTVQSTHFHGTECWGAAQSISSKGKPC